MKRVLLSVLFTVVAITTCNPVFSGEDRHFVDESKIPVDGSIISDFVPLGWITESVIQKELNDDGKPDVVLSLIEALPVTIEEDMLPARSRALVVLFQTDNGGLHRKAVAKRLLRCTACFGAMAGPEGGGAEIRVVNRVIIVEEYWGSREAVKTTLRFRYESCSGRIALIGEDIDSFDRATGSWRRKSRNLLTRIQLTEGARYDEKLNRLVKIGARKQRIPKIKRFIEDIDYQELEQQADSLASD